MNLDFIHNFFYILFYKSVKRKNITIHNKIT